MSNDRARLAAVPGLAKVPGPPIRPTAPRPEAAPPAAAPPLPPAPVTKPAAPSRSRASERSTGAIRDMSFTTPLSVRTKLREAASKPDITKAAVVLAAVEANADRLGDLITAERVSTPTAGALFPDPAMTPRAAGEPRVPESMRLTARNLDVLDELVARNGADDRSQLLTAALRAHLEVATR